MSNNDYEIDENYIQLPPDVDISQMTSEQIHEKLQKGSEDYKVGRVQNAEVAFTKFRNSKVARVTI